MLPLEVAENSHPFIPQKIRDIRGCCKFALTRFQEDNTFYTMKSLPIGIQSFRQLREEGCVYVDKTALIRELVNRKTCFLSRPRRFGKSLLVSTLHELFSGNKPLFEGLNIYDKWDWRKKHPVIRIDWSAMAYSSLAGLKEKISLFIQEVAKFYQVSLPDVSSSATDTLLFDLIKALHEKTGQGVVVLIDEYDKPILDAIEYPEKQKEMKEFLRSFYGVLKPSGEYLRFLFLTGVSRFANVSVFSALNNLEDMTINANFAAICGYTQVELENNFNEYIDVISKKLEIPQKSLYANIKMWYNGYTWDGETSVYNPFSTLRFFQMQEFGAFWFETGTPTFLIKILQKRHRFAPVLGPQKVLSLNANTDDPAAMDESLLLWQTGYLTIKEKKLSDGIPLYTLDLPNREVREAFLSSLVTAYSENENGHTRILRLRSRLLEQVRNADAEGLTESFNTILAGIPHNLIVELEAYYHSLLLTWLRFLDFECEGEVSTSHGEIDMVWKTSEVCVIAEVKHSKSKTKLDDSIEAAFAQIAARKYPERYADFSGKSFALAIACTKKKIKCQLKQLH